MCVLVAPAAFSVLSWVSSAPVTAPSFCQVSPLPSHSALAKCFRYLGAGPHVSYFPLPHHCKLLLQLGMSPSSPPLVQLQKQSSLSVPGHLDGASVRSAPWSAQAKEHVPIIPDPSWSPQGQAVCTWCFPEAGSTVAVSRPPGSPSAGVQVLTPTWANLPLTSFQGAHSFSLDLIVCCHQ